MPDEHNRHGVVPIKYCINGLFLAQPLGGIQRYASEMTRALDAHLSDSIHIDLEIAVPKGASVPNYRNIRVVETGRQKGVAWEQIDFARYLKKERRRGINLCNTLPLLSPEGITAIHDISYKVNPRFFRGARNRVSALWHRANYWVATKKADFILTGTDFSKDEIIQEYDAQEDRIVLTPDAWQHMDDVKADDEIVEALDLRKDDYYLSVSNLAPNKNINWILETARLTSDALFLIAGGSALSQAFDDIPDNVVFVGRVTDGELKSLMTHCKAFLFPTFYEGFGLPPLEAMACGAQVVVSDTPCMHEVYGDSVVYVDPMSPCDLNFVAGAMESLAGKLTVLDKYSWDVSAGKLSSLLVEPSSKYTERGIESISWQN